MSRRHLEPARRGAAAGALWLACASALVSCGDGVTSQPSGSDAVPRTEALGEKLTADEFDLLGAGVYEGPAVAVADVLADPDGFAVNGPLRLEGEVVAVDQSEGRWMDLGVVGEVLRVTWSRRGTVPPTLVGRTATVEGTLRLTAGVRSFVATGAALRK